MNQLKRNNLVRRELSELTRLGMISDEQYSQICARYPTSRWDFSSLSRWFIWFGALASVGSAGILLHEHFQPTLKHLLVALGVLFVALIGGARKLKARGYPGAASGVEFIAGIVVLGWSFTLASLFNDGSGNWPKVLLFDLVAIFALTYLLNNVKLLVLTLVIFFTWFGGVTGYVSGWGAYFFGMNYPLRFACAGACIAGLGYLHLLAEAGPLARYRNFSKAWISGGLFFAEMALWILSIFGNFGDMYNSHHNSQSGELLLFNLTWAALNGGLIYLGTAIHYRMLVGYGATFAIIQAYTLFFRFIAPSFGIVLSCFVAGGSALALVYFLEQRRKERRESLSATLNG